MRPKEILLIVTLLVLLHSTVSFVLRSVLLSQKQCGRKRAYQAIRFIEAIKQPKLRKQVIDELLNLKFDGVTALSPWEVKTSVAMCIDSLSDTLLRSLIRKLQAAGLLSSELLYITLRLACKKQWSGAIYFVLKIVKDGKFTTDIDGINSALEVFLYNKEIMLAIDLMRTVQKGAFGPDVRCDWQSFELMLRFTSRQADSVVFQHVHDFVVENMASLPKSTNEQIFMEVLQLSVLRQELPIARNVFALYERFHGIVQTRAYALLLTAHLDRKSDTIHALQDRLVEEKKHEGVATQDEQLNQLVAYIVESSLDADPLLGDLVLRYYCIQQDASVAFQYLERLWNKFETIPSMLSLSSYSDLLGDTENVVYATLFQRYCDKHNIQLLAEAHRYSLHRTDWVSLPAQSAADLINRAAAGSTLKELFRVDPVAASLVCDQIWRAALSGVRNGAWDDGSPIIGTIAQALLRTQVDCRYAGSLDVLEAVVSAETSARQLKRAVETQQTLDVHVDSTDSACVLREVVEKWIELDMRRKAAEGDSGAVTAIEGYLRPVQLYFSLVCPQMPAQEVAQAGMLLLAKQALLAEHGGLYATLRSILQGSPAARSALPWLDVAVLVASGEVERARELYTQLYTVPSSAGMDPPISRAAVSCEPHKLFSRWFSNVFNGM